MGISDKDRKILWGRSGNRCALCRRVLVAARTATDDEAVVGEEAHIAARSPGGPRHGECPPDVVDRYENLMLLCAVDHTMIDNQHLHYTSELLRKHKADHEAWVETTLDPRRAHLPAPEPSAETVVVPVTGLTSAAPELFVGRVKELRSLLNSLKPGTPAEGGPGAVVVSAVAGMGGIGKTTLAQHAAAEAVDRGWFPGGVVMVNLRGYDPADRRIRPGQVFGPLLHALDMPSRHIPSTRGEQAVAYHRHLEALAARKRPVLLVLDNASTADQVLDLLPRQAVHRAVVTTRDTLTLPSARRVELDLLTERESLSLLREAVRRQRPKDTRVKDDRQAGERLVEACGRLPLAVGIAAALLADDPHLTTAALADRLADTATRLTVLKHGGTAVASVIEVSWRQLQEREPEAARLLRLLTLSLGPDISTAAAAALADASEALVEAQLSVLRQTHLLHMNSGRWRMHDLVRLHIHAGQDGGDDYDAAVTRLLGFYLRTAHAAENYFLAPSRQIAQTVFAGRVEAEAWFDTHQATLAAAVALAATSARYTIAVNLAELVCNHSWRRWDGAKEHLAVARHAVMAATESGDQSDQARSLLMLGAASHHNGQSDEGVVAIRQALALWEDMDDRSGQGDAWNLLANVLADSGRFEQAIPAYRQSITLEQDRGDQESMALVVLNLAETLSDAGRFDEAIVECRHAIGLCQGTGYSDEEGRAWNQLGRVLRETRRRDEAIDAFRHALAAYRKADNRLGEAGTWRNVGDVLNESDRVVEATHAYETAIKAYREGGDPPGEADTWNRLGMLLREDGKLTEAINAYERAQKLWWSIGDRRGESVALHNRGVALHEAQRRKVAIAAFRHAIELDRETGDRASESQSLHALSEVLSHEGRVAEAREARRQAKALRGDD